MATTEPGATAGGADTGFGNERRDPQQKPAALFGTVLIALSILDYGDALSSDGRLLGIFRIPPSVNAVHAVTGLLGVFLARYVGGGTLFNKLGGVIYLVVSLVGTVATLAGRDGVNWPTNALHLALAIVVGWVGFEGGNRRPE